MLASLLWFSLATAFITFSLRLDLNHKGPGFSLDLVRDVAGDLRPVGLFDYVRRPFGVYNLVKSKSGQAIWHIRVTPYWSGWYCVFCLSFWTQIPVFVYDFTVWHSQPLANYPILFFSVPLVAGLINLFVDYSVQITDTDKE